MQIADFFKNIFLKQNTTAFDTVSEEEALNMK